MQCSIAQKRSITLLLFLVPFLMGTGIDLYVPSLPMISHYFQASNSLVQLTIGLYMLGYGVGQLFLGVLSDTFGRRKVLLLSATFYTLISFLAIFSPNIEMLLLYRLLQGLGIAGLGVACRAMVVDCFTGLDMTKAMSSISTCWALGPILGPFIGAYLQHYFNWQADFYFFGIYGLMLLIYTMIAVPETNENLQPLCMDRLVTTFKEIITNPVFIFGSILISLLYTVIIMFNIIGPFLIQLELHYSVISYGHIALFLGCAYFLGTLSNRFLVHYVEPMKSSMLAMCGALLSGVVMLILALTLPMSLYIIMVPLFVMFYLIGLVFPNMMAKVIGLFPKSAGSVNALFGSFMAVGVFVGSSLTTLLSATTQIPLTITYVAVLIVCFILFTLCQR